MIRVVLADDHLLVKEGLEARLAHQANIDVVASVSNGAAALKEVERLAPDILITDINMPKMSGIEVLNALSGSATKVIMLSMHDHQEYIVNAMQMGARGYVLKDVPSKELITAIETVYQGGTHFCSGVSERLFNSMTEMSAKGEDGLTDREKDVLLQIAQGECNKSIAKILNISVRTVETHRLRIKKKLGVTSTAGLVRYAMDQGWLVAKE
ncbi:response regulator [Thaumasiovibrio subtropicus]|uniref:response regulator n=1 Tax=Thaumasiovibrio subtropicus TaxID=1891207 RepID=UPI000B362B1D|nr:response regulator transcription factor [Thaumasiovibrio subtropicus]